MFLIRSALRKFNKLDIMIALYIFGVIVAALMGTKVMPLGEFLGLNFNISVAIFLLPMMFMALDAVNELYGRARAKQLVWLGVIVQVLLVPFIWLATSLPHAARFEFMNGSYNMVFGMSARIAIASIVAFAVAGTLDVLIFSRLKKRSKGRHLWFRSNISSFSGTLIDTVVFMTVAFYGVFADGFANNILWLGGMILPYWLAKCAMSVVSTPLVYAGVRYLRGRKKSKSIKNQTEVVAV